MATTTIAQVVMIASVMVLVAVTTIKTAMMMAPTMRFL
jgi:hypothetical protein